MDNPIPANVSVAMSGNRLRILVYILIAVTVLLTVATTFLMYERASSLYNGYISLHLNYFNQLDLFKFAGQGIDSQVKICRIAVIVSGSMLSCSYGQQ